MALARRQSTVLNMQLYVKRMDVFVRRRPVHQVRMVFGANKEYTEEEVTLPQMTQDFGPK